jgi:phage terminase large subunit-like protein
MKLVDRLALSRAIVHDGNQALAWMLANVVVEPTLAGEILPRKSGGKDSPHKIDGAAALFTAMARARLGVADPVGVSAEWI